MLLKKRTIIIAPLIILIVNFSSVAFRKAPLRGSTEARALELLDLLNSIIILGTVTVFCVLSPPVNRWLSLVFLVVWILDIK